MTAAYKYVELPGGVRYATEASARGYRVRWTTPEGRQKDTHRIVFDEARKLAYDLSGITARLGAPEPRHDRAPVTLLIDTYLSVCVERQLLAPQTILSRRSYLRHWALPVIGDLPCQLWDREATWRVLDRARSSLSPLSLRSLLRAMSAAAQFGVESGFLPADAKPTAGVKLPRATRPELDLPSGDQIEKLAACMVEITGQPWRALQVYLPCYSGLRAGEMLGLHGDDFNLASGELYVQRQVFSNMANATGPPKWGSVRTTVWPTWLDELVADRVGEVGDGPLFPGIDAKYEPYSSFLGGRFAPARERAGWPRKPNGRHRWTPHTLRHYFCTWALSKDGLNLDPADVARMAGHRSPKTTWETYIQPRAGRIERAREASRSAAR